MLKETCIFSYMCEGGVCDSRGAQIEQKLKFPSIKHCHVHHGDGLVLSLPTNPLHLCVHTPNPTQPNSRVWGEANSLPLFAVPSHWQKTQHTLKCPLVQMGGSGMGTSTLLPRDCPRRAAPGRSAHRVSGEDSRCPWVVPPRCHMGMTHKTTSASNTHSRPTNSPPIFHLQGKGWKWGSGKWPLPAPALLSIALIQARGLTCSWNAVLQKISVQASATECLVAVSSGQQRGTLAFRHTGESYALTQQNHGGKFSCRAGKWNCWGWWHGAELSAGQGTGSSPGHDVPLWVRQCLQCMLPARLGAEVLLLRGLPAVCASHHILAPSSPFHPSAPVRHYSPEAPSWGRGTPSTREQSSTAGRSWGPVSQPAGFCFSHPEKTSVCRKWGLGETIGGFREPQEGQEPTASFPDFSDYAKLCRNGDYHQQHWTVINSMPQRPLEVAVTVWLSRSIAAAPSAVRGEEATWEPRRKCHFLQTNLFNRQQLPPQTQAGGTGRPLPGSRATTGQ